MAKLIFHLMCVSSPNNGDDLVESSTFIINRRRWRGQTVLSIKIKRCAFVSYLNCLQTVFSSFYNAFGISSPKIKSFLWK